MEHFTSNLLPGKKSYFRICLMNSFLLQNPYKNNLNYILGTLILTQVSCPRLPSPSHGTVSNNSGVYNDTVYVVCDEGYNGGGTHYCDAEGMYRVPNIFHFIFQNICQLPKLSLHLYLLIPVNYLSVSDIDSNIWVPIMSL